MTTTVTEARRLVDKLCSYCNPLRDDGVSTIGPTIETVGPAWAVLASVRPWCHSDPPGDPSEPRTRRISMRVRRLLTCALSVLTVGALGVSPASAIANGAAASDGQFPFAVQLTMTGIQPTGGQSYDSACSAALISETWIMTAGHCFHDGDRNRISGAPRYTVTATLGTSNTTSSAAQTRVVTWVEQSPDNDIAVAELSEPVTGIAPLALNTRQPVRGQMLSFAGWGATTSSGTWSEQLNWGQVKVSNVRPATVLVKGHWPTRDTSACPYDSGAPYFDTSGPAPVLVSVESSGPACPHRREETTARVDVVVDWVRGVTDLS